MDEIEKGVCTAVAGSADFVREGEDSLRFLRYGLDAVTGNEATAGNLAFPFSPSDFAGGAVYEFALYHLTDLPLEFKPQILVLQ